MWATSREACGSQKGNACGSRGDTKAVINGNEIDYITVFEWYKGSAVKNNVDELANIKKEIETLKTKQKTIETSLSKLINQ